MKKIEAVIRVEKLDEMTEALEKFGCPGMMVTHIEGHGRQKGITEQFRGREFKLNFIPKVKIEIVLKDSQVDGILKLITGIARTGEIGDGKIFVCPVEDVVRIRTEEKGESAI
ncbi:MAG: P-II family nitrogen regulator [Candidatus Omnitrophota bacterium]|jgi:nitrogen regulatory protein P-II 1|nr:P-II family nitrogen regulator [Candidatus Omnitrophota bacterium]MDD5526436.1 P-II family nitrogen regulator [Candidatus Omnitrophota bacterium]